MTESKSDQPSLLRMNVIMHADKVQDFFLSLLKIKSILKDNEQPSEKDYRALIDAIYFKDNYPGLLFLSIRTRLKNITSLNNL